MANLGGRSHANPNTTRSKTGKIEEDKEDKVYLDWSEEAVRKYRV